MYFYVIPLQLLPRPSEARGSEQVCCGVLHPSTLAAPAALSSRMFARRGAAIGT
jgi:hypothetical protein